MAGLLGAEFVEFDVQMTKDNQLMIHHDFYAELENVRAVLCAFQQGTLTPFLFLYRLGFRTDLPDHPKAMGGLLPRRDGGECVPALPRTFSYSRPSVRCLPVSAHHCFFVSRFCFHFCNHSNRTHFKGLVSHCGAMSPQNNLDSVWLPCCCCLCRFLRCNVSYRLCRPHCCAGHGYGDTGHGDSGFHLVFGSGHSDGCSTTPRVARDDGEHRGGG